MRPHVRLDKATILAGGFTSAAPLYALAKHLGGRERKGPYPYPISYSLPDGSHVSTAAPGAKVPSLRLEFNPDSEAWAAAFLLARMQERRLSRVDFAVDYPGHDINEYTFERSGVSRTEIGGRGGRLETVYLGRRSSGVMLRCYDKGLEERSGEVKMRTEAQCRYRPGAALDAGVFDRLTVRPKAIPEGLDLRDEMKVVWAQNTPGWEQRCSNSAVRRRVRELLDETVGRLSPQPSEVLRENWQIVLDGVGQLTQTVRDAAEAAR